MICGDIPVGYRTENGARDVKLPIDAKIPEGAQIELRVTRPGESTWYIPAHVEVQGNTLYWLPDKVDTEIDGRGTLQIWMRKGEERRALSRVMRTNVQKSVAGGKALPPDPLVPYIERVVDAADRITGMSVTVETLPAGSAPTAAYDGEKGVLNLGLPAGPKGVTDVTINGQSIITNGIAQIPLITGTNSIGIVKIDYGNGIGFLNNGAMTVVWCSNRDIDNRVYYRGPICSNNLDYAVKAAMCDGKGADWTSDEQKKAQRRIGIDRYDLEIQKLKEAAEGHLYMMHEDATESYSKTVPADALSHAMLDKIGGKTLVWNQVLEHNFNDRSLWRTDGSSSELSNGMLTYVPTGVNNFLAANKFAISGLIEGNIYAIVVDYKTGCSIAPIVIYNGSLWSHIKGNNDNQWHKAIHFVTLHKSSLAAYEIHFCQTFTDEDSYSSVSGKNPMIFDLTTMFGAGNEPTIEEFQAMFPDDYYPYSKPMLMSFSSKEVVSKGTNLEKHHDISAIAQKYFPDGMKSVNIAHDEIDFERMVSVKRIQTADLSKWTFDRTHAINGEDGVLRRLFKLSLPGFYVPYAGDKKIISDFFMGRFEQAYNWNSNHWYVSGDTLLMFTDMYNSADEIIALCTNNKMYYHLSESIETPITEHFDDIEVESGGSLTFANDQGESYKVPVPNQETFMLRLPGGGTT